MTQSLPRIKNDFYPTPNSNLIVQALTGRVKIQGTVFEPCAGDGAIASCFPNCIHNDPYSTGYFSGYACYGYDMALEKSWKEIECHHEIDWVITNPPFKVAPAILPLAFDYSGVGVAFLLRLTYLEPCGDRLQWLADHADQMTHLIPLNPRPRFRSDTKGTDNATCAWFVWQKDWSWKERGIDCPFQFVNWREPKPPP